VRDVTKVKKPHALGFCVGGTILTSALAVLKGRGEDPVESLSLMTTLLDFADAGEIGCLVDEASVAGREATIGKGGVFQGRELAQVFSSLRANDLIWQYVVGNYLKGKKPEAFDLLYWNSDSTNIAGPFIAWYLRNMYLENNLRVPGKLEMLGVKVDLGKVDVPAYLMAAREDHIVPWTSAYLVRQLLGGDTTFVLGASGHIAGAINPASKNRRSYWVSESSAAVPEEWLEAATEQKGSWWLTGSSGCARRAATWWPPATSRATPSTR
jgi:polyhydroxyalkanoate synthase